jgi:hypothetical protein
MVRGDDGFLSIDRKDMAKAMYAHSLASRPKRIRAARSTM